MMKDGTIANYLMRGYICCIFYVCIILDGIHPELMVSWCGGGVVTMTFSVALCMSRMMVPERWL